MQCATWRIEEESDQRDGAPRLIRACRPPRGARAARVRERAPRGAAGPRLRVCSNISSRNLQSVIHCMGDRIYMYLLQNRIQIHYITSTYNLQQSLKRR